MLSSAVDIFLGLYSAFNQGFCPTCYEYKHGTQDLGPIVDPWKTLPTYVWIERAPIVSLNPSTNLALHVSLEFLLAEVGNKHEQPPSVWSWGEASTSAGAESEDLTTFSSLARRCLAGSFICIFRMRPISWKQIEIPWDVFSYLLWKTHGLWIREFGDESSIYTAVRSYACGKTRSLSRKASSWMAPLYKPPKHCTERSCSSKGIFLLIPCWMIQGSIAISCSYWWT